MTKTLSRTHVGAFSLLLLASTHFADASTLAYWRFEAGPDSTNVAHGTTDGYPNYAADVPDASGNGNALSMWATGGGTGFSYDNDVSFSSVLQTGAANNFSIQNTGGFPASFTNPSGPLKSLELAQWTIEVSWKPEAGGFRTVVGRDGQGVTNADTNLAALYLGATNDNRLKIQFVDEAGVNHIAQTAAGFVQGFTFASDPEGLLGTWYNIAATSDGSTLSLYVNTGSGYTLVAQTTGMTGDTRLTNGSTTVGGVAGGGGWGAGDWTVGRGLYNGGHTDRAYGFIDEVRISDAALTTDQFLFSAVPEPSTGLIMLGGLGMFTLARRRRA